MLLRFYIGADNKTRELEKDKIVSLASRWYKGATFIETTGIWEGEEEKSCILEVQTDYNLEYAHNFITNSCKVLKQEAIGLSVNGEELQFLS